MNQIMFERLDRRKVFNFLPDNIYLRLKFGSLMREKLDLSNPKTFNEKLQWLKLYNRKPEFTMMVDKYGVREYIAEKLGEEYLIPLLGVWDNPDEIDFDKLPNRFVLKCNHNSGLGMCICKDKSKLDIAKVKAELSQGLKQNYYTIGREWPYRDVPRKIIAEQYMQDGSSTDLRDYKFYCFNGVPKFLYISQGLADHRNAKMCFMDLNWELTPFQRNDYEKFETLPEKPSCFDKMITIAKELSEGIPFLRVDLYEINQKIYFGELTFYPGGGFTPFYPSEWEQKIGGYIDLPEKKAP